MEEILTSAQSDELPTRSLIAWNGSVVRRTWTYPEHWEQLGDTELLALIDSAARDRRREA